MNQQETYQVLSLASARDGRAVDAPTAAVWADDLADVSYEEALEGVRMHFRQSTEYLKPAHVIANVKLIRDRAARAHRVSEAQKELGGWTIPDEVLPGGMTRRERVWRRMLDDPNETERTKAFIRKSLGIE